VHGWGQILLVALVATGDLAGQALSGRVELSERLQKWQAEIAALDRGKLVLARVYVRNGAYILPDDVEERDLLVRFFGQYEFRSQFVRTHAININVDTPKPVSFVVLNMDRMKESGVSEEEFLSHELGHAWLHQRNLRAPALVPGMLACEAIHTGDVVQHVLIRREQARRGIDYKKGWVGDLEKAYQALKKAPAETAPPADLCLRLHRLSLLVDLAMGLEAEDWPNRSAYAARLTAGDPLLAELVQRQVRLLSALELENRIDYYAALGAVRSSSTLLIQQLVEQTRPVVLP